MRKKVTVVGGGFVGSTTAQRIVDLELADVVLTDILDGPPAGKALDMVESTPDHGLGRARHGNFHGLRRLQGNGQQRRGRRHRGLSAQAGHEPRRPA